MLILTKKQREATKLLKDNKKTMILLAGGSRSGKTMTIMRHLILAAFTIPNSKYLIARMTMSSLKASIWSQDLPEIINLLNPKLESQMKLNHSDFTINFHNGSYMKFIGLEGLKKSDKVLGVGYNIIFLNEISQINDYTIIDTVRSRLAKAVPHPKGGYLQNKTILDCNPPSKSHWSYKLFVEHKNVDGSPYSDPESLAILLMNPVDNPHNHPDYIKTLESFSPKARDRFLNGVFANDVEGSLWDYSMIAKAQYYTDEDGLKKCIDSIEKIVIAMDPATTSKENSDETGIIVAGATGDKLYVLEDQSGKYTPNDWAMRICNLYNKYKNQGKYCLVIVEANQGGDMVKNTIKLFDKDVYIYDEKTSKSKMHRAEAISALYHQNKVFHVNTSISSQNSLALLEEQLLQYTGLDSTVHDDRLDALCYALKYLGYKKKQDIRVWSV